MKLTRKLMKDYAKRITTDAGMLEARRENKRRYLMLNGATKEVISQAISKEFKNPATISELMSRLVPLNIMQKIIGKLAGVYKEAPIRTVKTKDEDEQQQLNDLVEGMEVNMRMKEANRFFKLNKKALIEPYLDDQGVPSIRVLPAHTYEVFSIGTKKKSVPNVIVKIDEVSERLIWWSKESHWITDFKGEVMLDEMGAMKNPKGENPYGELQFVFINESSSSVCPIQDDDLLAMSVAIPVVLTDLLFGLKYQCWAIIWTVGKVGDIPFNPNSVIQLDFGEDGNEPSVNQIKPEMDSDKMLNVVMALVSLLLTTKNLQSDAIVDGVTTQNAASGVAKILDSAESSEDKKDQQAYFLKAEKQLWEKKLPMMMDYWKQTGQLAPEFDFELAPDFEVAVVYQDPRPMMTEAEQVETSKKKVDAKFSTIKRELKKMHPDMDDEEIEKLYQEILAEAKTLAQALAAPAAEGEDGETDDAQADLDATKPQGEDVQSQVLNGAQMTGMVEIVTKVASGEMPRDAGVQMLAVALQIDVPAAEKLMGGAGSTFKPTVKESPAPFNKGPDDGLEPKA